MTGEEQLRGISKNPSEQYKCGHCGCERFRLFKEKDTITTECTQCKIQSSIEILSSLIVAWKKGEERGVMCTGWNE